MDVYTSPTFHHPHDNKTAFSYQHANHVPPVSSSYPTAAASCYPHLTASQTPPVQPYTSAFQPLQDYNENRFFKQEIKTASTTTYDAINKYYPQPPPAYSHLQAAATTADICRQSYAQLGTFYHQPTTSEAGAAYQSSPGHYSAFSVPTANSFYYSHHQQQQHQQQVQAAAAAAAACFSTPPRSSTTSSQYSVPSISPPVKDESVVSSTSSTVKRRPGAAKRGRRTRKCQCSNCQLPELTEIDPRTGKPRQRKHNCHFPGCTREYGKTSHLKSHIMWHENQRPFECHFVTCEKKFTRSDELSRHIKTHTKEHLHKCPVCGKGFGRSDHRYGLAHSSESLARPE